MTSRTRVLIADDHPVFRFGLRSLLQADPQADLEVVGEAASGAEAIAMAADIQPDVILMDLSMPGVNGIEATQRIVQAYPRMAILVLTMVDDGDSVFAAMRAGARGYVLKGAGGAETLQAIRTVASGGAIFSPDIARRLLDYFAAPRQTPSAFPELTQQECKILDFIARGYTNAAIAERLVLTPKTVRNYVSSIFGKLQVASRTEAVIRARDAGMGR